MSGAERDVQQPFSLRELFDSTVGLDPQVRARFLAEHCPDLQVRVSVERLLQADASDRELFAGGASAAAQAIGDVDLARGLAAGSRLGPFELIAFLGEGGSSTVFHARRELEGVRQDVALKILRRGLYSPEAQRQFRRERQALAQLKHPGIAHLIEGGVSEDGTAYIALDLIAGKPITEFVREHRLDLRRRLELFMQVCRAVAAAHRALIVHRDLKPSNVLVTDEGQVKLLDFGIAKLLDADEETQTRSTAFTPAYAAPEQHLGEAITTATDVYALGILLGELITGQRLTSGSGRTPSAQVNDKTAPGVLPAAAPVTRRALRGDLDNIVLKAIETEPERRYASAGALADDVERMLNGKPVEAHPPSVWYRTQKFISRHRGGVALSALFVLGILAALGLALWQANVARHEAARANAVRSFMIELFDAAKARLPRNERPTPETLVREAIKREHDDPDMAVDLRADLLQTLGSISVSLGDYAQAEPLLDQAVALQTGIGAAPQRLETLVRKADLMQRTNRNAEADKLLAKLLPDLRRVDTQPAIDGLMLYASTQVYGGHPDEGIAIAKEAAAKAKRILPEDSLDAIKVAAMPGETSVAANRHKDSLTLLEPVVQRWRASKFPLDSDFAQALMLLADARDRTGDLAGAEALHREGIALRRRIYDKPHDDLASALEDFATFLIKRERFEEAQSLLEEALTIDRQVLGPESLQAASTLDVLGTLAASQHAYGASERYLRDALTIYDAHVAEAGHEQDQALTRAHFAQTLNELGKLDEAQDMVDKALVTQRALHGEGNYTCGALFVAARIALHRGDAAKALALSTHALDALAHLDVPAPRMEILNRQAHAMALDALGKQAAALDDVAAAIATIETVAPSSHAKRAGLLALQARLQRALGQTKAANVSVTEARALNVPARYLAAEDAATIGTSN